MLDYTMTESKPITEMIIGAPPLEKHYEEILRGQLIDEVQFDKFSDLVSLTIIFIFCDCCKFVHFILN